MMEAPWSGEGSESSETPDVTVVIPALDEERALPGTLAALRAQIDAPPFELILADGGSADRTVAAFAEIARAMLPETRSGWATVVLCERRGRAAQMNAGASRARGKALLFLHADTHLPAGGVRAVERALGDPRVAGGGFRHRFREPGLLLRVISAWATARSIVRRVHYGDQAIFVRRSVFESVGGFPDVPLFEDLRFARLLARAGRVVTIPQAVETSARRLIEGGVLRTGLQFARLRARHALGADPASLHREYRDVR